MWTSVDRLVVPALGKVRRGMIVCLTRQGHLPVLFARRYIRLRFAGREHRIGVVGSKPPFRAEANSDEHFFKEHHWGFGITRGGKGLRYQVDHPIWDVYPVVSYSLDLDFAAVYGAEWGFLQQARPVSTVFAVGSEIAVYPKGQMTPLTGA